MTSLARITGIVALLASTTCLVSAETIPPTEVVTLDELEQRVTDYLDSHPDSAEARFELGRAYLFAYANDREYFLLDTRGDGEVPRTTRADSTLLPAFREPLVFLVAPHRWDHLVEAVGILREAIVIDSGSRECQVALAFAYADIGEFWEASAALRDIWNAEISEWSEFTKRDWQDQALKLCEPVAVQGYSGATHDYWEPVCYATPIISHILFKRGELTRAWRKSLARSGGLSLGLMDRRYWKNLFKTPNSLPEEAGAALNKQYPQVPETQNGALHFLDATDAQVDIWWEDKTLFNSSGQFVLPEVTPISEESIQLLKFFLEANHKCIELIRLGAQCHDFRYPTDFRLRQEIALGHVHKVLSLVRFLRVRATYATLTGEMTQAVESLLLSLKVSDSLAKEPVVVAQLVRGASVDTMIETLEWVLAHGRLSANQLSQVQNRLHGQFVPDPIRTAIWGQIWLLELPFERTLEDFRRPGIVGGQIVEDPRTEEELEEQRQIVIRLRNEKRDAWRVYEKLSKVGIRAVVAQALADENADGSTNQSPYRTMLSLANRCASIRLAQTALALERFRLRNGELPKDLDTLVPAYIDAATLIDPFSGKPPRMQVDDEGYVVYSVGYPSLNERAKQDGNTAPNGISFRVGRTR